MKRKFLSILLLPLIFTVFFSGIIRHDIDKSKYIELANQAQFDCVISFISKDSSNGGSGVLVNNKFVLTAAHCCYTSSYDTIKQKDGSIFYIPTNTKLIESSSLIFNINGKLYTGNKIIIHPNYSESTIGYDLALIELNDSIVGISLPELNKNYNELNASVIGVGYGYFCTADKPELMGKMENLKIAGENTIDKFGGIKYLKTNNYSEMYADFDSPEKCKKCNKLGSEIPKSLEYLPTGGDSGGGLFRLNGNKWQLIGITRGGGINLKQLLKTGYYGQTAAWTRISVFYDWIIANSKI